MSAHAFVAVRDTCAAAAALLKHDVATTLHTRVGLLCEEADREEEEEATSGSRRGRAAHPLRARTAPLTATTVALPCRVLLPFVEHVRTLAIAG